jgi:hypothetical protein
VTHSPGQSQTVSVAGGPDGATTSAGYLEISGSVDAELMNSFEVSGNLHVLVTPSTFTLHFGTDANNDPNFLLKVGGATLLSYTAQGDLQIDTTGTFPTIVGAIQFTMASQAGAGTHGLSFGGNPQFFLEINTTGQDHTFSQFLVGGQPLTVSGKAPGQQVAGPYGLVYASADLTLHVPNTSTQLTLASGTFFIEATSTSLTLTASATANLGPLGSFAIGGSLKILDNATDQGIVGSLDVTLTSGALSLFGSSTSITPPAPTVRPDGSTGSPGQHHTAYAAGARLHGQPVFPGHHPEQSGPR